MSIEEITLTDEQVTALGAVSNIAYDITSSMEDGTFAYDLTLPVPEDTTEETKVVYAESVEELDTATEVTNKEITGTTIKARDLDHFTVFVLVQPQDLATSIVDVAEANDSWFFYDDESAGGHDIGIDNTIGTFVTGPDTAPYGEGSVQISVSGTQRRNLATYQFSGQRLDEITELGFSTYNSSAGNGGSPTRTAYLNFNVDFDGSDTWQRRLIYTPQGNEVLQNTWQYWDAIKDGDALWHYSGSTWPVTGEPGSTAKTWNEILSDYPNARVRVTDSWLGIRVGSPYADGYTENIDGFVLGNAEGTTIYNFDPDTQGPEAPTNLGFNSTVPNYADEPVEVVCGGYTNANSISHHWGEISDAVKYQRQWVYPGKDPNNESNWQGAEEWTTTYTNYRSFGGGGGTEGLWHVRVRAQDEAGNWGDYSDACAITYDKTPPSVPINPSHNGVTIPTNNFDFDWDNSTDATPVVYEFQSSLNPAQTDGVLTTGLWKSGTLPTSMIHSSGAPDGTWYWQVRAIDAAGNKSDWSEIWSVTLDTTAPAMPTGLRRLGADGNEYECSDLSIRQTMIPMWNENTEADFDHYEYSSFHANGSQGLDEKVLYEAKLDNTWVAPEDGTYGFAVRAVDTAGNKSAWALSEESHSGSCQITYDSMYPEMTNIKMFVNGTESTLTKPGDTVTIQATVEDSSGVEKVQIWIREYPWAPNYNELTSGLMTQADTTTWEYTYTVPNTYKDGDSLNQEVNGNYYNFRPYDAVGNSHIGWRQNFTIDATKPTGSIDTPLDGTILGASDTSVTVSGTVSDYSSGIKEVKVRLRNYPENTFRTDWVNAPVDGSGNYSVDIDVSGLAEDEYEVAVVAYDNVGHDKWLWPRPVITIDRTAPVTTLTSPSSNIATNDSITITGSSTDIHTVSEVNLYYSVAGENNWQLITTLTNSSDDEPFSFTYTWTPSSEGLYDIKAAGTDTFGNVENSAYAYNIDYDLTNPADSPQNVKVTNITSNTADATWEAPNPDDDVSFYRLSWKHEDGTVHGAETGKDDFNHQLNQLYNGEWTLYVKAMDDAGNFTESSTKFRVGPGPSSGGTTTDGTVLGVTTEGFGTGGAYTTTTTSTNDNNTESDNEESSEGEVTEESATTEEGAVLGDTTCSGWIYYLPLIMLLTQLILILGFEFVQKEASIVKLVVAIVLTVAAIALFNWLKNPDCYTESSGLSMVNQWFVGLSILTGLAGRLIGHTFIEE